MEVLPRDPREPADRLLRDLPTNPEGLSSREAVRRLVVLWPQRADRRKRSDWPGQVLRQFTPSAGAAVVARRRAGSRGRHGGARSGDRGGQRAAGPRAHAPAWWWQQAALPLRAAARRPSAASGCGHGNATSYHVDAVACLTLDDESRDQGT